MEQTALPIINLQVCDRCGTCIDGCPENALLMSEHGPEFHTMIVCTYCLACEELCPTGAIRAPLKVIWEQND